MDKVDKEDRGDKKKRQEEKGEGEMHFELVEVLYIVASSRD